MRKLVTKIYWYLLVRFDDYYWIEKLKKNQSKYLRVDECRLVRMWREVCHLYFCRKLNSYININTDVSNVFFYHGGRGVFLRSKIEFRGECIIWHNVTIGISGKGVFKGRYGQPVGDPETKTVIGDGVWIGANAVVVGDVVIGDGAKVGAGATVAKDIPAGATVICRSEILTKK